MLSEMSGLVAGALQSHMESCEVLCFAEHERSGVISVLVANNSIAFNSQVECKEYEGYRFEVLSVIDLRVMFRLEHIELFAGFLKRCVILKDEFQDLFDVKRTFSTILVADTMGEGNRQHASQEDPVDQQGNDLTPRRGGYFAALADSAVASPENGAGYRIMCWGLPQIHRFIRRQCFVLLEELKDVTRSFEFAFHRNARHPQSIFSIELFHIDLLNKAELEKRLALFCATRNHYPGSINFRLFPSSFGNDPKAPFVAAVCRRTLTEYYPQSSNSHGYIQAITRHMVALLFTIIEPENLGEAKAAIDILVRDQLYRVLNYKEMPGEITDQEKITYQLDLHTDTLVTTQKATVMEQLRRDLKFRDTSALYETDMFRAFAQWQEATSANATEATGLLFDSFCVSPYESYYFLRLVQVLLNDTI